MSDNLPDFKALEQNIRPQEQVSDLMDMHDSDIAVLGQIWTDVQVAFSRKSNTRKNLDELEKVVVDRCFKEGLVVRVHTSECVMGIGPVTIEPIGRVASAHEGYYDHELKKHEVVKSKVTNEDFLGQKGKIA